MATDSRGIKRSFDGDDSYPKRFRDDRFYGKLCLLVPTDCIGILIGKNGSVLKQMCEDSGCRMSLQNYDSLPRGAKDRGIELSGSWDQIQAAELMILEKLINRKPMEEGFELPEGHEITKWYIANDSCGMLIGKGGETIKRINSESGSKVKLAHEEDSGPGSTERMLMITGTAESNQKAIEMIKDKVGGQDKPTQDSDEQTHMIPTGSIGTIIGTGGASVKNICEVSGAKVVVMTDAELPMGLLDSTVRIQGNDEQVEKARELLDEKVQEWRDASPEESADQEDLVEKVSTIKTYIPQLLVGHLIGKKGVAITEINSSVEHGRCKVLPKARSPSTTMEYKIVVYGGKIGAMLAVQKLVLDRLSIAPGHVLKEVKSQEDMARKGIRPQAQQQMAQPMGYVQPMMMMQPMQQMQQMPVQQMSYVQQPVMYQMPTMGQTGQQQAVYYQMPQQQQTYQMAQGGMMQQQPQQQQQQY